jgi:hypothetical protein
VFCHARFKPCVAHLLLHLFGCVPAQGLERTEGEGCFWVLARGAHILQHQHHLTVSWRSGDSSSDSA